MLKTIKISLIIITSLILIFVSIVIRLTLVRTFDIKSQIKHMKSLNTYYESVTYEKIDENRFVNFDLNDQNIRLNDIQMIASHNSYKKKGPAIGRFFVGLGDSFEEAKALKYGYKDITQQLEAGVRSFEFDIRYRRNQFELIHVPLVDSASQAINFELLLEEIYLFSSNQDNHVPIIILLEFKSDWMILDPFLDEINDQALVDFDKLVKAKIGDNLFGPSHMLVDNKTLNQVITQDGWPSVENLLNKVMFVMHPGKYTKNYYELDMGLKTQSMFIGSYNTDNVEDYASFFIQNDVDINKIKNLVDQNYMVRTRMDTNLVKDLDRYQKAIASGAHILSTDFSVGRSDLDDLDHIYFEQNKMIIVKED